MMKTKLFLVLIFCATLLTGCKTWSGYNGTSENYEYYHRSGKAKAWEEDIIELAARYLEIHPYLMDEEMLCYYYYFNQGWKNTFDAEKKEVFLSSVNQLIPQISKMTDLEVLYEMQKIVATLGDFHSMLTDIPYDSGFPIMVQSFEDQGELKYILLMAPEEYENLIYSELISINGVSVSEIIEKLALYISSENEYSTEAHATNGGFYVSIQNTQALKSIGILGKDEYTATFEFRDEEETKTIELEILKASEMSSIKFINKTPMFMMEYFNDEIHPETFWHKMLNDDLLYMQISSFSVDQENPLIQCVSKVTKEVKSRESINVIVDLRNNSGGRNLDGDKELVELLKNENIKNVYVLINSGTASQAVSYASRIDTEIEKAILVGTPAAEGSESLGYSYMSFYTMTNHGYSYGVANTWYQHVPEGKYNALYPEIVIYQNLEDYENGVDTVISTILEQHIKAK